MRLLLSRAPSCLKDALNPASQPGFDSSVEKNCFCTDHTTTTVSLSALSTLTHCNTPHGGPQRG